MDGLWLELNRILARLNETEYWILCGLIFLALLIIYFYSIFVVKQSLHRIIYKNIKTFQRFFDNANNSILILSSKNKIIYANPSMLGLLGLPRRFQDKVWKDIPQVKLQGQWKSLDRVIDEVELRLGKSMVSFPDIRFQMMKNPKMDVTLQLSRLLISNNSKEYYTMLSIQDLEISHVATDINHQHKLSHLPNQLQAEEDIISLFAKMHLQKKKIAFVLMGFDNYAMLRSILGYEESNDVIVEFAKYLNTILSSMHISVYHTFDNHFLLIIKEVETAEDVITLVHDIQLQLAMLYKLENMSLHLTLSAGIAVYPDSGTTSKLLDNTYHALAQAQTQGNGKIQLYIPKKNNQAYDDLILHNDMEDALNRGDFEVYYQPIVAVKGEEVVAAEALIRWIHPTFGMIPPFHFIELMEKTGFIVRLGAFIVDEVFKQQKRWDSFGFKPIEVSINVSMVEIATGDYVENIVSKLSEYQLSPKRVKFEITEGMAMIGESQTEAYFRELKALGVGISLDDFGTGYTSFGYLKKFPANVLKIDKSLVDYIIESREDQRIVHAIIDLGHTLGMKIVVEGVETREMVDMLASFGADYIQGYYFSKPLPVLEFQQFIRVS
jgi:polar amino acid transport system substrate-binding protein